MEEKLIRETVKERTKAWDHFGEAEVEKIVGFAKCALLHAASRGIEFDHSAGITFVSHLSTLYQRLFLTQETVEIEAELFHQISPEIATISQEISTIATHYFHQQLDVSELFLIGTHLGSMQQRIQEGIID